MLLTSYCFQINLNTNKTGQTSSSTSGRASCQTRCLQVGSRIIFSSVQVTISRWVIKTAMFLWILILRQYNDQAAYRHVVGDSASVYAFQPSSTLTFPIGLKINHLFAPTSELEPRFYSSHGVVTGLLPISSEWLSQLGPIPSYPTSAGVLWQYSRRSPAKCK